MSSSVAEPIDEKFHPAEDLRDPHETTLHRGLKARHMSMIAVGRLLLFTYHTHKDTDRRGCWYRLDHEFRNCIGTGWAPWPLYRFLVRRSHMFLDPCGTGRDGCVSAAQERIGGIRNTLRGSSPWFRTRLDLPHQVSRCSGEQHQCCWNCNAILDGLGAG